MGNPVQHQLDYDDNFQASWQSSPSVVFVNGLSIYSTGNYTLLPSDYLIGPTAGEPELCLTWPKASPPSSDGIDWQMGAAFLRTVYTVFRCGFHQFSD